MIARTRSSPFSLRPGTVQLAIRDQAATDGSTDDVDNLRACYDALPEDRTVGVDGVTKAEYGRHLEENLKELSERLRRMGYRPQPKRRSYIPGSEKGRSLGISCFEDKLVELAVKRVLELFTRPYLKAVAMAIVLSAASINAWMRWAGRFSEAR